MRPDLDQLDRPAGRVLRVRADAGEIGIVPAHELALLVDDVHLGDGGAEIGIGLLPAAQRPRQPDPEVAVDVVVARDHEQPALGDARRLEQSIEEWRGGCVFTRLAAMRHVAGGEDQIGLPALRAIGPHRPHQRPQDDVPIVGIAALEVEIRDVQPAQCHASMPKMLPTNGLARDLVATSASGQPSRFACRRPRRHCARGRGPRSCRRGARAGEVEWTG